MLAQLKADYPEELRVVYRHFPLASIHDKALLAAQAAEAAGLQGQFWEMHSALYLRSNEWASFTTDQFETWAVERAAELGLDTDRFLADMNSPEMVALAQQTNQDAIKLEVPGTPFMIINGRIYGGPMDYTNLATIVELLALEKRQYAECPTMVIDPLKTYTAKIETEKGDIVIELLAEQAPLAVNNFVFLAREGWYDGVVFHRVLEGFMAQTGDPTGTGFGGPGYAFANETADLSFDSAGVVAMANSGPDSNGSQFFITFGPATHLDGGYTIFGKVLEGQDVVDSLTRRDPSQGGVLPEGDVVLSVTIEEGK